MTAQGLQLLGDLRGTLRETLAGLGPLEPPVALIDFPNHGNVGDSAIWQGETAWLRQTVGAPAFVCEIANYDTTQLRNALSNTGTILLHGGGNLGDLWPTHQVFRERILDEFADRRVIQLPQSIRFESGAVLDSARRAFARHQRFTLLVREQRSLEFARREFQCDIRLCPDMAFALSPIPRPAPSTDLVLLARTDKESRLRPIPAGDLAPIDWLQDAESFARSLERRTRFWAPRWGLRRHLYDRLAAERLWRGCQLLGSARAVVTDRLHAHILCLLMGVPHVLLDNTYGKVRSFHETWTKASTLTLFEGDVSRAIEQALAGARPSPRHRASIRRPEPTVDITVMICTWNNAAQLDRTLQALGCCQVPAGATWEIVVVNNDGSDATDTIVGRHANALPIVLVHEPVPGLSRARNRGLEVARGKLIVFTDDDVTVGGGWLEAYWEAYTARPECFLGGPIRSEFDGGSPDPRVLRFAPFSVKGLDYGSERRMLEPTQHFIGPNWACPRALLEKVGGFDESKGLNAGARRVRVGEETDLMRRLQAAGAAALYVPEATLDHRVPLSKSTLRHVAERAEAAAYDGHIDALAEEPVPTVLRYPRWRIRALVAAALVTAWRRIFGGDWIAPYVEARQTFGVLRATRDRRTHSAQTAGNFRPASPSEVKIE